VKPALVLEGHRRHNAPYDVSTTLLISVMAMEITE